MERSAPPTGRAMSRGQSAAATAHSTSNAEYIVTEIKQHKRATALILGIIILSAVTREAAGPRGGAEIALAPVNKQVGYVLA